MSPSPPGGPGRGASDSATITEAVVDFLEGLGVTTYSFSRTPSAIVVSLPNEPDAAIARHAEGIKDRLKSGTPAGQVEAIGRDPRDRQAIIIAISPARDESQLRDEIMRVLKAEETELRRRGIESLRLFGSVAARKSHPNDVDLLARFRPGLRLSAFDIADTQAYLERRLGRRVDLSNEQTFPSAFKTTAESTGVPIFGT
jgi:predicted nucleotidyltransferase